MKLCIIPPKFLHSKGDLHSLVLLRVNMHTGISNGWKEYWGKTRSNRPGWSLLFSISAVLLLFCTSDYWPELSELLVICMNTSRVFFSFSVSPFNISIGLKMRTEIRNMDDGFTYSLWWRGARLHNLISLGVLVQIERQLKPILRPCLF